MNSPSMADPMAAVLRRDMVTVWGTGDYWSTGMSPHEYIYWPVWPVPPGTQYTSSPRHSAETDHE